MPTLRHDRISTVLFAIATAAAAGAFVSGLAIEPRAARADSSGPLDRLAGAEFDDTDVFSSSDPAMGMGGGMSGMSGMGGMSGGGGEGAGAGSGSGSSGMSAQAGGSQPTSGGNFTGGGGMTGGTSSGGGGSTTAAMSSGGTPAGGSAGGTKAKPGTGAGANAGKSSATSSKASKSRIAWLSAQQKARLDDALEGIYQAELNALNDGAFFAVRRAACVAGPGPTTPVATTPSTGTPGAPGAPAATPDAPAAPPAEAERPPTLSDGTVLPKGCDELQALAEKCEKDKRFDDALLVVASLVRVRGSAKDWAYAGFLHENYGTYEGSEEAYGKSLAIEPMHLGSKVGKAFVDVAFGRAAACAEGMAKDPNAPKAEFLWQLATSFVAYSAKLGESARAALEQSIATAGQDVLKLRAAIELGIDMSVLKPLVGALDVCLRSAPEDVRFHGLRLVLAIEEGPPADALAALETAEKLAPADVEPLLFQAYLQLKDEKYDQALSILKTALKMAPTNGRCALLNAHAFDRKGSKETLMAYLHAAELDPKSAEPWIASALIVHNRSDYEDAEGKLLAAIKAEPRNPEPLYYLAIIQGDRLGFLGKAEDTLKLYRHLGGDNESALAWLQSLEDAENN